MIMSWTWTSLALVFALFFFLQALLWERNTKNKKLPPGPRGFPIFGSLNLLGKSPHRDLHELAKKYGPIMFMRLGFVPTVVVSSSQAAEQFLKEHDLVFASRPSLEASKYLLYGKDFVFAEYGSYWRTVRKICTLELLTSVKISSFQALRKQEIDLLIEHIKEYAAAGVAVDLSAKVSSLIADVICRMIFGKKYVEKDFHERGFKAMAQESMRLMVIPDLGDYYPLFASLDLQGLTKSKKAVIKVFDDFLEKIIDEHVQSKDPNRTKDFVDVMFSFMGSEDTKHKIEREHVKAILTDILMGATDTSSTAIEWALSALLKHPRIMKKVQKELENVVGVDRTVQESDLDNLEYLDMVVKETFRIYPPGGILPRESREDCTINGFHIPKKSLIIISAWSIGRDPEVWRDPEKFFPERFAGSDIDLRGRHFQLLPFGSGRRGCPGMMLGLIMVKHVVAQIVHCFDWELPNGMLPSELDMMEEFGLVIPRAKHLMATPIYRLSK